MRAPTPGTPRLHSLLPRRRGNPERPLNAKLLCSCHGYAGRAERNAEASWSSCCRWVARVVLVAVGGNPIRHRSGESTHSAFRRCSRALVFARQKPVKQTIGMFSAYGPLWTRSITEPASSGNSAATGAAYGNGSVELTTAAFSRRPPDRFVRYAPRSKMLRTAASATPRAHISRECGAFNCDRQLTRASSRRARFPNSK